MRPGRQDQLMKPTSTVTTISGALGANRHMLQRLVVAQEVQAAYGADTPLQRLRKLRPRRMGTKARPGSRGPARRLVVELEATRLQDTREEDADGEVDTPRRYGINLGADAPILTPHRGVE